LIDADARLDGASFVDGFLECGGCRELNHVKCPSVDVIC
jgi:hypothetical protein